MIEVGNLASKSDSNAKPTLTSRVIGAMALTAVCLAMVVSPVAMAQSAAPTPKKDASAQPFVVKIGFVNTQRILQDSGPSKLAQENIEKEFKKRNDDLQKEIAEFRKKVQQFEKDAPVLAESDRNRRQRELGNLDADLQRKQREIQEDFNRRRNEEFAIIIERANAAIMQIADKEQYDLILQDAVTVSDRVDITDKVIKALESKN